MSSKSSLSILSIASLNFFNFQSLSLEYQTELAEYDKLNEKLNLNEKQTRARIEQNIDNIWLTARNKEIPGDSGLGSRYQLVEGLKPHSLEAYSYLAGSHPFVVEEYEVFAVMMKENEGLEKETEVIKNEETRLIKSTMNF